MVGVLDMNIRGEGWQADCPQCVASKFTCDKHYRPEIKVGQLLKHPDHKKPVEVTEISGDMIAFTVTAPIGSGQHRMWAKASTFTARSM